MANTFTQLAYHIVFSTKYRRPTLTPALRIETYKYIAGIIDNKSGQLIEIGGMADHVHILAGCSAKMAVADFIRDIKANSSRWLRDEKKRADFQWQTGYGAFTVSHSVVERVRRYIRDQEEHHRVRTFKEEYLAMLERHGIKYELNYVFDEEYHA